MKLLPKLLLIALLPCLLQSCVVESPAAQTRTGATWKRYLNKSPLSYPVSSNPNIVRNLENQIAQIPLDGIEPEVASHIVRVKNWCADYPAAVSYSYRARNNEYMKGKNNQERDETLGGWGAMALGEEKNADRNETIGQFLGWGFNEWSSRSRGEAARNQAMQPLNARAKRLAREEDRINERFGLAPTLYLESIMRN